MEVLHAVFHRALVGADFVVAAQHQGLAAGVHALGDLVVLDRGFHVGGALGLDELALEAGDLFGVIELHHVQRPVHARRVQGGDGEHMRIPLDHDVRVVGQPDRAALWQPAFAVLQQHLVPLAVDVRARLAEAGRHAHRLHRVLAPELPLQVVTGDEVAQAGVEGADVVVLQVDLDEGLPVVVALVQFDVIEHVAVERQVLGGGHAGQVGGDVAAVVIEQQTVPLAQRVVAEVQAGVALEVRCAQQLAAAGIGPAVDGADDVAARMALAFAGNVEIGNNVEIGANTCIDRAVIGSTKIGNGVKLDNLIQVAHNVELGDHTVIAAQAGISGSTKFGKNVLVGGQAGITGHLNIGDGVKIQAQAAVIRDVESGKGISGVPAIDAREHYRQLAAIKQLPDLIKRIKELEKKLANI